MLRTDTIGSTSKPLYVIVQSVSKVITLLERLDAQVELTPLEVNPQRYGNKAFRDYYSWLCQNATSICQETLEIETTAENFDELVKYLTESVGNPVRIDYGTGHELAFIAFLLALFKMGFLKKPESAIINQKTGSALEHNEYAEIALCVFPVYLRFVRHLQTYFRMEPAGSHGAWSLDDFQFVPYIWGSSQLMGTGLYEPSVIPNKEVASKEAESCLLFSCVNYIFQVKTGPFAEHSSCLQSLSNVPHWEKINSGMLKMYKGEVLNKFPVVQHFLFGNLLRFEPAPPGALKAGPPGGAKLPSSSTSAGPRKDMSAFSHQPPFVKPTGDP
ncbi:unnamed protein product [Mesocestoides corti]|uniref:Serine/threonine-protein phosphatase 2A activator n=1 Tax=Mesocestoides corti TaxID=53468 RepID=A0A0R3U2X8_MESCO|nr:unnamed protein product [Mesocestoides corti]